MIWSFGNFWSNFCNVWFNLGLFIVVIDEIVLIVFVVWIFIGNFIWYGVWIKFIVLNDKVVLDLIVNGVGSKIFLVIYFLNCLLIVWLYC